MKNRIVYLKDLESAKKLHQFIQELDKKYKTDSSDDNNSFGRINLEKTIIDYSPYPLPNCLFWAHALGHKSVYYKTEPTHTAQSKLPVVIEEQDLKKLNQLRKAFREECTKHEPPQPKIDEDSPKTIENYDKTLEEQGFASGKDSFSLSIKVDLSEEHQDETYNHDRDYKIFNISYERLKPNFAPHFSTKYCGSQGQESMDKKSKAYAFYKKWDKFHLASLTKEEFEEMKKDAFDLKEE